MILGTDIEKAFGITLIQSEKMNGAINDWDRISSGAPRWLDPDDDIETINAAKMVSAYRARLVTLDLGIAVSGNADVSSIENVCNVLISQLPDKVADAERLGGIMIKWNGENWDFVRPGDFGVTKMDGNGSITGAVFAQHITRGTEHYTRVEYHRFESDDGLYRVTNRAFRNRSIDGQNLHLGTEIPLALVPEWAGMVPEVTISGLEKPLFGYFRIPGSNIIDPVSPLGCACFADGLPELKALDVAISRKNGEIMDSKHVTIVGQAALKSAKKDDVKLPRYLVGMGINMKDDDVKAIHEHSPTILTEQRIKDINFDLSLLGVKCGFSEGAFVLDGQRGVVTATQVESDDRDTIQTIKEDRDALRVAVEQAVYGAYALMVLSGMISPVTYELEFAFGDITYNYEEDKASWKAYAMQGWVPVWLYLVKFEGMSEEEAKALVAEASANTEKSLFGDEE